MARKRRGNKLERWEVSLVKAMLAKGQYNDQDILPYFTRPTRSINHRVISEIRTERKHKAARVANDDELNDFLRNWPDIDPSTGLNKVGDELLIKSREAMIAAVQIFNSAGLTFRAELFIVTSIIGWTYLLHAWFKREGIDYRHKTVDGIVLLTKEGAEKYWELSQCLASPRLPISDGEKQNLKFLLELRHEIEHRSTSRIDDAIGAKLQACCINYNNWIKMRFGAQFGLEKRLPIALQFVTFDLDQTDALKRAESFPPNIATMISTFEGDLTDDQRSDARFSYRAVFVPITSNRITKADRAIEFVRPDSDEALEASRIFLKETDKKRYTATDVVSKMRALGFRKFNQSHHTKLWQSLEAKQPRKGFGRQGDYKNTWVWYENWIDRVKAHCEEQTEKYT